MRTALPKFLGGSGAETAPRPANDQPPAPREPTLDQLEYRMRTSAERVAQAQATLEQALDDHRQAEAAFVARAGRLLYHHTIVAAEGENDGEASTGVSQTPPSA